MRSRRWARADIFAAFDAPDGSRTNSDIRLVNTATDPSVALPAGVNTSADEFHPSVTADGFVRPSVARDRGGRVGHPSIDPAQPRFVVYDDFRLGASGPFAGELRVLDVGTGRDLFQARSLALPGVNTSVSDESRAGFTPDGRYLGFLRHRASVTQLLVWDTHSQQFLSGVNIGAVDQGSGPSLRVRLRGNVSLFQRLSFATFNATSGGHVAGRLLTGSNVGVVVHRVVGYRRLFARRVPRLRLIGRVPLGHHDRGRLRIRWNRRVNGRRLRPGLYQVTPRVVTRRGRVRDLG